MPLSAAQRQQAIRALMPIMFPNDAPVTIDKTQADAILTAVTAWMEGNQGSYNAALAGTAIASQTAAIKAAVLAYTALARYG